MTNTDLRNLEEFLKLILQDESKKPEEIQRDTDFQRMYEAERAYVKKYFPIIEEYKPVDTSSIRDKRIVFDKKLQKMEDVLRKLATLEQMIEGLDHKDDDAPSLDVNSIKKEKPATLGAPAPEMAPELQDFLTGLGL